MLDLMDYQKDYQIFIFLTLLFKLVQLTSGLQL